MSTLSAQTVLQWLRDATMIRSSNGGVTWRLPRGQRLREQIRNACAVRANPRSAQERVLRRH